MVVLAAGCFLTHSRPNESGDEADDSDAGPGGEGNDFGEASGDPYSCGNGVAEGDEQCDGEDLKDVTCVSLGEGGGTLLCDPETCTFDVSMCTTCCHDAGGYGASQDPFDAGGDVVQDAAIDAGWDASADAGQADCLPDADDCPSGFWCRPTYPREGRECVPFVGESERCGGRVTVPERCWPGLVCLTGSGDDPGTCIVRCSDDADCGTGRFCSTWYQACIDNGSCFDSFDCDNPDNAYARIDCDGYGTCNGRACAWTCGDAACRDITGIDLDSRCYGFLGFAVVRGECTAVNRGCDGRDLTFYEDEAACQAACIP